MAQTFHCPGSMWCNSLPEFRYDSENWSSILPYFHPIWMGKIWDCSCLIFQQGGIKTADVQNYRQIIYGFISDLLSICILDSGRLIARLRPTSGSSHWTVSLACKCSSWQLRLWHSSAKLVEQCHIPDLKYVIFWPTYPDHF